MPSSRSRQPTAALVVVDVVVPIEVDITVELAAALWGGVARKFCKSLQ